MASLQSFRDLIFADARDHAHYTLYNRTYFTGLLFVDSHLSAKTAKIGPHEISLYTVRIIACLTFLYARNSSGLTPMACAASEGHFKIIELLISAKAEVNCMNDDLTPLHWAAKMGHRDAVNVLLLNKANVSAVNAAGENPLDVAIESGHK
jgi:hypothetical protein